MYKKQTYWIKHYSVLESTNKEAQQLVFSENVIFPGVIIADEQTAGRGRNGRKWTSQRGNIYLSIVVAPNAKEAYFPQISFVAALALRQTVASLLKKGTRCTYKWPNDLLVEGNKIGGILLECTKNTFGRGSLVIVGIGLNVAHHPVLEEGYRATHLLAHQRRNNAHLFDIPILAGLLCDYFFLLLRQWEEEGFAPIREKWLRHAAGIGTLIKVRLANQEYSGIFKGLSPEGACILSLLDGQEIHVTAGDVFLNDAP